MSINQFAGGPSFSEKPEDKDSKKNEGLDSLSDSSTKEIFGSFEVASRERRADIIAAEEKEKESENPDSMLESALNPTETPKNGNEDNNDGKLKEQGNQKGQELKEGSENNTGNKEQKKEGDSKEKQNVELEERLKNSKYYPLIQNLKDAGWISNEQFGQFKDKLKTSTKEEEIGMVKDFINSNVSDGKAKSEALKQIDGKDKVDSKNFKDSDFFKDSKELKIDIKEGEVNDLDLSLANSYTKIPSSDGNENKQRNLSSSMDFVKNDILLSKSEDFKKQNSYTINKINESKDLNDKYSALKDLHELSLIDNGKLGGKEQLQSLKKQQLKKDDEKLQAKYQELIQKSNGEIDAKTKSEFQERARKILEEGINIDKEEKENKNNEKPQVSSLEGGKQDKEQSKKVEA